MYADRLVLSIYTCQCSTESRGSKLMITVRCIRCHEFYKKAISLYLSTSASKCCMEISRSVSFVSRHGTWKFRNILWIRITSRRYKEMLMICMVGESRKCRYTFLSVLNICKLRIKNSCVS